MGKTKKSVKQPGLQLALRLGLHIVLGTALLLVIVFLGAVLVEKGTLPRGAGTTVGFVGVTLGGCLAGLLTAFREKNRLLPYAGLTALGYSVLLLLLGAVLFPKVWLGGQVILMLVLSVGGCLLGALLRLAVGPGKKRRR